MSNPFSDFAKEAVPYARRRKLEKAKAKALTPQEKKQAEQEKLRALWLEGFNKRKKELMGGEFAASAMALCSMLERLGLEDGDLLIDLAQSWQSAPRLTRFLVLQLVDEALVELRERHLLPPFDDPLEGDNVFIRIRELLK